MTTGTEILTRSLTRGRSPRDRDTTCHRHSAVTYLLSPSMSMEANLTRGLSRSRCNFFRTQRVFSRAQSTVSKVKPVTAKVDPKPQMVSLTWPDYLAIRHSKRKWQMVGKKSTRQGAQRVTSSILSGCYGPFRLNWFCRRSSLLRHP